MFRTDLSIAPQERQLARTARVLTLGSCFADSLGERLQLNKVTTLVNPFGTVFQPLALAQLLRAAAGEGQDWQQHVVEARGRWQSFDFHGSVGAESPVELLQAIQETVGRVGDFVSTADAVVLTLGTAWAYRLRETGELVNNLHKRPAALFEKELLTADEIVNGLAEVHALLRRLNPDVRIILTVSPVRHLRDTLPLNAVSKSVLRVACHYLSELLPGVSYFPAYELLTDDLRDYRFYAADMLHPSPVAEDYIWDKFARAYFDADFGRFRQEWVAVRQALGHRPLHLGAPEHRTFLDQTRERLEQLLERGVEVRPELRDVQRQLAALPPPKPAYVPPLPEDNEERIDIGGEESERQVAIGQPTAGPAQAAERRADNPRGRHDDRRNGRSDRSNRGRRNDQAVAAPVETETLVIAEVPVAESVAADVEELLLNPTAELLPEVDAIGYPAKKKKRRSRGGAKRTARKNAARLATEQPGAETSSLAEEQLSEELAHETAGFLPEAALETPATVPEAASDLPPTELVEEAPLEASEPEALPPADAPKPHKRGTGPTPKKSKVITKSGLIKRGKRTSLFRAADQLEVATTAPEPAAAPIISPPIIPEILLERPTVAETVYSSSPESSVAETAPTDATPAPEAPPAPEPAPTPEATPVTKPSKPAPRRGRPKAAADAATEPAASKPAKKTPKTPAKAPKPAAAAKKTAPKKAAARKPAAKKAPTPVAPPDDAPAA